VAPSLGLPRLRHHSSLAGSRASVGRDVYCNRALVMPQIQAVGFDMDYTLAEYLPDQFDMLAYNGALKKLVQLGYPEAIRQFTYDPRAYQRGLVLDRKRGNVLKMDRHKYVKVAYHGLTKMSSAQRKATYAQSFEAQPQFTPPDYVSVDTAFSLIDVALFCQLVDHKDHQPQTITMPYERIYKDVRHAVDLCHCDGEIKDVVAMKPSDYIRQSPELGQMLAQLKLGGKQVFLLTNSLYDYTDTVMRFLLGPHWLEYFDLVICGARKPGFLLDPYLPLFQVHV
jgi:HAD superfamily 5'-nucleotidase-like hydrolase